MDVCQKVGCLLGRLFSLCPLSILFIEVDFLLPFAGVVTQNLLLAYFSDRTIVELIPVRFVHFLRHVYKAEIVARVGGPSFVHDYSIKDIIESLLGLH